MERLDVHELYASTLANYCSALNDEILMFEVYHLDPNLKDPKVQHASFFEYPSANLDAQIASTRKIHESNTDYEVHIRQYTKQEIAKMLIRMATELGLMST